MKIRSMRSLMLALILGFAADTLAKAPANTTVQSVTVADFSRYNSVPEKPWQLLRFDDSVAATHYQLRTHQGVHAVEAIAESSMALLARPLQADLERTPVLCWRWWVEAPIKQADMTRKSGDDYAARVYITFDLPDSALSLGTRIKLGLARTVYGEALPDAAINYIWDNRHPIGTTQANAYTDRAQMLVVRSGMTDTGRWMQERRNLREDLKQLFGADSARTLQLAVAADSDNTGGYARALFADIHLVAAEVPCRFPAGADDE